MNEAETATEAERKPGTWTPEEARAMARRSVETRQGKVLRPSEVDAALGPLQGPQDVRRWLETAGRWVAQGILDKGAGAVIAKCCAEWTRSYDMSQVEQQLGETRRELARVKSELAEAQNYDRNGRGGP
jgi:hypothetical protein